MDPTIYSPIRIVMPDGAPKIVRKEQVPDARKVAVIPIRAAKDKRLTAGQFRVLLTACSYSNRAGLLWAGQKRIGQDLGISQQAVSVYVRKLEKLGYIKTVKKGFGGERADTRQIVFREDMTVDQIAKVAEDKAPYMVEREQRIAKKRGRKSKAERERLSSEGQSSDNVHSVVETESMQDVHRVMLLKNKVSSKIWQLAVSRAGNDQSFANIKSIINRLLR